MTSENKTSATEQVTNPDSVIANVGKRGGDLLLNRPKALNSLDLDMVRIINAALDKWRESDEIEHVVVRSEHPKAFCAGGDVRTIRQAILDGDPEHGEIFFAEEYEMNAAIAEFSEVKPYIAIIDGIAMGGGLGVSMHGSHRIVTERASASMPEMAIGFIPDVGITHFSQHVVGRSGSASKSIARFTGLTGYRLSAADMLWAGWATHLVPSADLESFRAMLDDEGLDAALEKFSVDPVSDAAKELVGESALAAQAKCVEECFSGSTWLEIEAKLDEKTAGGGGCSRAQIHEFNELLRSASAASLVAAVEVYEANAGADVTLRQALDNEMRVGEIMRRHRNFAEGVRAVLVDKDRNARFDPQRADAVDPKVFRAVLN